MTKIKINQTNVEIEEECLYRYGAGPFVTIFQSYARILSTASFLKPLDLVVFTYILSYINTKNYFKLPRRLISEELHISESSLSRSISRLLSSNVIIKKATGFELTAYTMEQLQLNPRIACKCSAMDYQPFLSPHLIDRQTNEYIMPTRYQGIRRVEIPESEQNIVNEKTEVVENPIIELNPGEE